MIQEIVARRDATEHFAYPRGCFALAARADGPRAGQFRCISSLNRHSTCACIRFWPSRRGRVIPRRCGTPGSREDQRPIPLYRGGAAAPRGRARHVLSYHLRGWDAIAQREFPRATAPGPRSRSGAACASLRVRADDRWRAPNKVAASMPQAIASPWRKRR